MSTMRAVYTNIRAARTAIKDAGRLRQIATVLVRHGLGHVVETWNLQDKVILGLLVEKRPPEVAPKSMPERITLALQDLGPTFVKMGQILSTRPDLIPQAVCDQFKTLQDNVTPITLAQARTVVESSLGAPVESVFDDFSELPLACASIAQVHTARLKTGEEVVVKIQRPGIRATIESDLNILYFVARQLEAAIPEARAFDPVSIVGEFDKAIRKELDFSFEADNLERFDRNFADWDTVYIPRCYRQHSSSTVMVMERLIGRKITDAADLGVHDMDFVARESVRMLFRQVFEDGFFHGDLHPGNLFVLDHPPRDEDSDGAPDDDPPERIGLIDFGLVGRMSRSMKDQMADLLLAIVTRDNERVARCIYEISIRQGKVNYAAWESDTAELMERHFASASLREVDFGAVVKDLIERAMFHDVRIPPDYTMFFKALMTVEGIGKIVSPDLDLVAEIRPYAERLVAERYSPERVLRASVDTLHAFARFGRQFPVTAHRFLEQIEDGRLAVGFDEIQLRQLEEARDRRLNRAVLAFGAATLLLCGTLARNDAGLMLLGAPVITTVCYVLGGALGGRLLLRVYRDKW